MIFTPAPTEKDTILNAWRARWNGALVEVWAGSLPASAATPITHNVGGYFLIGTGTLGNPAFPADSSGGAGLLTANPITPDASADYTGQPTFYRIKLGATPIGQGDAGVTGCSMTIGQCTAGVPINFTSLTLSL